MKHTFKTSRYFILLLLCVAIIFNLSACSGIHSVELTADLRRTSAALNVSKVEIDDGFVSALTNFSVELFRETANGQSENSVISPLSAAVCLSMMANGADGSTLSELEAVLGMDIESLNGYLYTYLSKLEDNSKIKFESSNSMWLKNDGKLKVEQGFLENAVKYFDAEVYSTAFDTETVSDINRWVENNTDGEIKKLIEALDEDTVMCLVNALLFEAEWSEPVQESSVKSGSFHNANGSTSKVSMMHMSESYYFDCKGVMGFTKSYKSGALSFVGLLPDEGTTASELVAALDAELWSEIFDSQAYANVNVTLPMFETESKTDLRQALINMGIHDAFSNEDADLSKLGSYDESLGLYCNSVKQNATIRVNKNGTRATAATEVSLAPTSGEPSQKNVELTFDRPFVYAIVDSQTHIPLFMGVINDLG